MSYILPYGMPLLSLIYLSTIPTNTLLVYADDPILDDLITDPQPTWPPILTRLMLPIPIPAEWLSTPNVRDVQGQRARRSSEQ
jgi:hypothetical protein